jgi:hypothetical protein
LFSLSVWVVFLSGGVSLFSCFAAFCSAFVLLASCFVGFVFAGGSGGFTFVAVGLFEIVWFAVVSGGFAVGAVGLFDIVWFDTDGVVAATLPDFVHAAPIGPVRRFNRRRTAAEGSLTGTCYQLGPRRRRRLDFKS